MRLANILVVLSTALALIAVFKAAAAERPKLSLGKTYHYDAHNPKGEKGSDSQFDVSLSMMFLAETMWIKDEATYTELRWSAEALDATEFRINLDAVTRLVDDGVEKPPQARNSWVGKTFIFNQATNTLRDDAPVGRTYKLTPKQKPSWPAPIDPADKLCREKATIAAMTLAQINNPGATQGEVKFLGRMGKKLANFAITASFDDKTKGYRVETEYSEGNGGWCQIMDVRLASMPR